MEAHTFARLAAFFIDIFLLSILLSLLTFWIPVGESKEYKEAIKKDEVIIEKMNKGDITPKEFITEYFENYYIKDKETVLISIISVVVTLGYFGTFTFYNNGQTLGKKLMKIKIVSDEKKEASHASLIIRSLINNGIITSALSCIIIMFIKKNQYIYTIGLLQVIQTLILVISVLMVAFREDKRGIHDMIAKTKVIQCK